MHPVEAYLKELAEIRSTGGAVPEESYYGALEGLLNEVGRKLKPRVRCVRQVADRGAGHPDFGLYTADQFQRAKDTDPIPGQLPERGVIEAKPTSDDSWLTAQGKQVTRYWGLYRQVLVTNYRDFIFVGQDDSGSPVKLETFGLADTEAAFWAAAGHARKTAQDSGDRFLEFLRRVMLHPAPLTDPELLAWFLASYAKEAKARIEAVPDLPGLAALRKGLEESLGLKFQGEEGEHFFRATLVQTLFYGIFSSWVLWTRKRSNRNSARFNWHEAAWNLHVPMIASLFEQIATPQKLKPLGIDEVLDWTGMVLNRVAPREFFRRFEEEHAVQYFYEPFLKAYDPDLRKKLGVWFTPPEIVKYQVARVDTVLREELDIQDGLADPNVYVLDPCCGTGAYLVEVLRTVHETLKKKGANALTAQRLKEAAMQRIFGFEILPAPFVVAHLQLGLILRGLGAPLSDENNERAAVYLTNALTGWEPPTGPKQHLLFPELEEERDAAENVKRDVPILVILGNPPYNAFAGTSPEEEGGLVEPYKEGLTKPVKDGGWGIKKFNLDDLYVRFFRIAERRIVKTGRGIVSYISNFSYLGDPSFVVMRQRFLEEFDELWFDCMNGDSRETGKLTPEGKPDPSVFSTEQNREGIRVGTAIGLLVRKANGARKAAVRFRHFWGVNKRAELFDSLNARSFNGSYQTARPQETNRFSFRPEAAALDYLSWPKLPDLCARRPHNGLMEKRGSALIDIDRRALESRLRMYYDRATAWAALRALQTGLTRNAARFPASAAREKVISSESYQPTHVRPYALRPFDTRWCYYSAVRPLWNEPRPSYAQQCWPGNAFLISRPARVASPEGMPIFFTAILGDNDLLRGHAYYLPFQLRHGAEAPQKGGCAADMFRAGGDTLGLAANLSPAAQRYLSLLGLRGADRNTETARLIWMHALAIGYSPAYLSENADGIRQDWPRIPLPNSKSALLDSAELGEEIAALLDTENSVWGVTTGDIRPELKTIAVVSRGGGGALNPNEGDLDVSAGWGHAGKGGVTMPGKGRIIERPYSPEELEAIEKGAKALDLTPEQALENLGPDTRDVYLNDLAFWKNVPANVWNYYIGGYQVIKKWLSYRERKLLGRPMKMGEVEYVSQMARRLAAIVLLQPALDANYRTVKSNTYPWPST